MNIIAKEFTRITSDIQKAQTVATYRALNKALSKTNTAFLREAAQNLGVPTKTIRNRFFQRKANSKNLTAYVSYGVQFGLSYEFLKPKIKLVSQGKGKQKKKKPTLSVKLPEGRTQLTNAWLWQTKSGKQLVLERKGKARKPTRTKRLNLLPYAPSTDSLNDFFFSDFQKQFDSQLQYEISKRTL